MAACFLHTVFHNYHPRELHTVDLRVWCGGLQARPTRGGVDAIGVGPFLEFDVCVHNCRSLLHAALFTKKDVPPDVPLDGSFGDHYFSGVSFSGSHSPGCR